MSSRLNAKFVRFGVHLINIEAVQHVSLRKDGAAIVVMPGPKKSLQQIVVPKPAGQQLWDFVQQELVVADFGDFSPPEPTKPLKPKKKDKKVPTVVKPKKKAGTKKP